MREMEARTGHHNSQIARWENGRRVPLHLQLRLRDLDRIAELEAERPP
jgi:hypothetical protein